MTATFTWIATIDGTDVADLVIDSASVNYGRASQFDTGGLPTAVLQLVTTDAGADVGALVEFGLGQHSMPSGFTTGYSDTYAGPLSRITLGAPITVQARTEAGFIPDYVDTYGGLELTRFTGRIQAIEYEWDRITLTCLPPQEAWGRLLAGGTDGVTTIPQETDTARVTRLCAEAGVSITIEGDPGPQLLPITPGTKASSLLAQLEAIAADCDALLFCDRDGVMHYRTKNYTPVVTHLRYAADEHYPSPHTYLGA